MTLSFEPRIAPAVTLKRQSEDNARLDLAWVQLGKLLAAEKIKIFPSDYDFLQLSPAASSGNLLEGGDLCVLYDSRY
jgi:hypothetical protein